MTDPLKEGICAIVYTEQKYILNLKTFFMPKLITESRHDASGWLKDYDGLGIKKLNKEEDDMRRIKDGQATGRHGDTIIDTQG